MLIYVYKQRFEDKAFYFHNVQSRRDYRLLALALSQVDSLTCKIFHVTALNTTRMEYRTSKGRYYFTFIYPVALRTSN